MPDNNQLQILEKIHADVLAGGIKKNALRKKVKNELNNINFESDNLEKLFYCYYNEGFNDCANVYLKIFPEIITKLSFYENLIKNQEKYINDRFIKFLLGSVLNTANKQKLFVNFLNMSSLSVLSKSRHISFDSRVLIYFNLIEAGCELPVEPVFELFLKSYESKIRKEETWDRVNFLLAFLKGKLTTMVSCESNYSLDVFKNEKGEVPFWLCFIEYFRWSIDEVYNKRMLDLMVENFSVDEIKSSFFNLHLKSNIRLAKSPVIFLYSCGLKTEDLESKKMYGYGNIETVDDFNFFYENKFNINAIPLNHFLLHINERYLMHTILEYLLQKTEQILNFDVVVKINRKNNESISLLQYIEKTMKILRFSNDWSDNKNDIKLEDTQKLLSILVDKMRLIDRIQIKDTKDNNYKKRL